VFEAQALRVFNLPNLPASWEGGEALPPAAAVAPVEVHHLPGGLSGGTHKCQSSQHLKDVPELLLLAAGPRGERENGAFTSIYRWRPSMGAVDVYPQIWFTADKYDVGYQWITRVARDPRSARIVGDGLRIGRFVLDENCGNVAAWLPG